MEVKEIIKVNTAQITIIKFEFCRNQTQKAKMQIIPKLNIWENRLRKTTTQIQEHHLFDLIFNFTFLMMNIINN